MKKNLLLRLCLLMSVVLTLFSCTNEDIYSSAENQKQEIVSKSLWKEDTLFIKRIYDHFQKSYMSTEADRRSFFAEHGTPFWEYTMTMGFKRTQLFVPLVKNNQIIGVMRVQREDKKAFYSFTKDDEALQFFDIVMYNRNLYELQPQKDEKLNQSISSKGGYTWTCTKRIVITGYHMEGDVMVMETSALDVCKYTYTGNKPPVDHIDVYTDGMEGGGGGDEEEGEEYAGSPCEKLKLQNANANYKGKIAELDKPSVLSQKKETGYSENKSGNFTLLQQSASTTSSDGLTVPITSDTKGYLHTHLNDYEDGEDDNGNIIIKTPIRMFSPADVNALMSMAEYITDGDYSEIYGTMVSSSGSYTIKFNGTAADVKTGFSGEAWRQRYIDYKRENDNWTLEKLFLNFLKDEMNVQGVELYKIKDNGAVQKKSLKANNNVQSTDCPQ